MKSRALLETEINSQYSKRFEKFGPTAKGVFWASTARQEKRFDLILEEIQKISGALFSRVLDNSILSNLVDQAILLSKRIRRF